MLSLMNFPMYLKLIYDVSSLHPLPYKSEKTLTLRYCTFHMWLWKVLDVKDQYIKDRI